MRAWILCGLCAAGALVGCHRAKDADAKTEPAPAPAQRVAAASDDASAGEARFLQATPEARTLAADPGDLPHLRKRGTLRILVERTEETTLPRSGTPASEERAELARFARSLHLTPQLVLVDGHDQLIPMLQAGKGDVIAAEMTVTKERSKAVAFTWPIASVKEVLVGREGAKDLPHSPAELAGREVTVRKSSSYVASLKALGTHAPKIAFAPETEDPEHLAYEVGRGTRALTVVDSDLLTAIEGYDPDVQPLFAIARGRRIAWAVRKDAPKLLGALNAFIVHRALSAGKDRAFTGDLDAIKKRGVLRVLTRNNPVTYFLERGEPFGFDYELAKMAAEQLGVRLEVVVPPRRDLLIPWLLAGKGDVIAADLTVTQARAKKVRFSRPYLKVHELLVGKKGSPPLSSLKALVGKRIVVRRSSSYFQHLTALEPRFGPFQLVAAPEDEETEALIDAVAGGRIPLTVADSDLVQAELTYRDDVVPLGSLAEDGGGDAGRPIAFAVRPNTPRLAQFLDGFVARIYRGLRYNMAVKRYFQNRNRIERAHVERAGRTGELSPYDALFKKYGRLTGLDWRLLAAQAYQESRFDPHAHSWVGAQGLFQVMPTTGHALGFDDLEDPDQGVHAGVLYLSRLIRKLDPSIPFRERVRFALAAYNAGLGHVLDARRVAAEHHLDPDKWFGNVEKAMLMLQDPAVYRHARSGFCRATEPVHYVAEILARYQQYTGVVKAVNATVQPPR